MTNGWKLSAPQILQLSACLAFFVLLYYLSVPFGYGIADNVEELPLIFKKSGIAEYADDTFVQFHTTHFVQVTPYVTIISWIYKFLHVTNFPILFFTLHILSIVGMYLCFRTLLQICGVCSEYGIFAAICGILVIHVSGLLPYSHGIFKPVFDPIIPTRLFGWLAIFFLVSRKDFLCIVTLFITTLLHPIIGLLLLPCACTALGWRFWKEKNYRYISVGCAALVLVLSYSLILWCISHQKIQSGLDASEVLEVNAENFDRIPKLFTNFSAIVWFSLFCTIAFWLSLKNTINAQTNQGKVIFELNSIALTGFSILILSSLISQFVRIPLLIQLTPYKLSGYVASIAWILLFTALVRQITWNSIIHGGLRKTHYYFLSAVFLSSLFGTAKIISPKLQYDYMNPEMREVISWITSYTDKNDMFMDYVQDEHDLAIMNLRVQAKRPVYYDRKTLPLVADEQVAWFRQLLNQWQLPEDTKPEGARALAIQPHAIHIPHVVEKSGFPIRYALLPQKSALTFDKGAYETVFSNASYLIVKVP